MKKEEYIKKYGKVAYKKWLQKGRDWRWMHPEKKRESDQVWRSNNPEKVEAIYHEQSRKGGKHYERQCKYFSTGLPHERQSIRKRDGQCYRPYKKIIAPDSQLHHEWVVNTANYRGVALVEKYQHQHGYIDVIQILEGEITLLTEAEIQGAN